MKSVELNQEGNFSSWPSYLLEELKNGRISPSLGNELVFENKNMKIWNVLLLPGERLPFRYVNCNFNFVSMTNSMVITRESNGRIGLHHLEEGDSMFLPFENRKTIFDLENAGEEIVILHVSEFKQAILDNDTAVNALINK